LEVEVKKNPVDGNTGSHVPDYKTVSWFRRPQYGRILLNINTFALTNVI
jgi:hypothetical protein